MSRTHKHNSKYQPAKDAKAGRRHQANRAGCPTEKQLRWLGKAAIDPALIEAEFSAIRDADQAASRRDRHAKQRGRT